MKRKVSLDSDTRRFLKRLMDAAFSVVYSADDTGCSEDLTVVSAKAIEHLRNLLTKGPDAASR